MRARVHAHRLSIFKSMQVSSRVPRAFQAAAAVAAAPAAAAIDMQARPYKARQGSLPTDCKCDAGLLEINSTGGGPGRLLTYPEAGLGYYVDLGLLAQALCAGTQGPPSWPVSYPIPC